MKTVNKNKLFFIFIPIFLQTFFFMLSSVVDTMIVSSVSDEAVAAVGTASTYVGTTSLLFAVISGGLLAVMTQYIGAGQNGVAYQGRKLALIINCVLGVILSIIFITLSDQMVEAFGVSESIRADAALYMKIVGAGCLFDALTPLLSSYLIAFDKSKFALASALAGNIINLALDCLLLFACKWGVMGVAVATLIGKFVTVISCFILGMVLIHGSRFTERVSNKLLLKQIIRIGLPSAIETTVYSVAMSVIMTFLNRMDSGGFNAAVRTYANQISTFSYCVAYALAQANVVICGWCIGGGNLKECYPSTKKAAIIGICAGIAVELLLALISPYLFKMFTTDQKIVKVVRIILFIDIALEVGRAGNLIYGQTLKGTGDSIFPMVAASITTALVAIGGSYLFGVVLKMEVYGVYIALSADEVIRAIIMFIRWISHKWEKKVLVKTQVATD